MTSVLIHSDKGIPASRAILVASSNVSSSPLNLGNSAVSLPRGDVLPVRAKEAMELSRFLAATLVESFDLLPLRERKVGLLPAKDSTNFWLMNSGFFRNLCLRHSRINKPLEKVKDVHADNYTNAYIDVNANSCLTNDYSISHNQQMKFSEWLRARIDERGLTEQALENLTADQGKRVPQATINRILRGETKDPRQSTVNVLIRSLGVDPNGWLTERPHEARQERPSYSAKVAPLAKRQDPDIATVVALMEGTDERGRILVLGAVREALKHHKPAVKNRAK